MHTATQLHASQFRVEIGGKRVGRETLLSGGWLDSDRLGVIIDRPFGAVGASNLIQLAITAFFDVCGRPPASFAYPEIYLLHVAGRHGDFAMFDFWPPYKEVEVGDEPGDILRELALHAITIVAIPEGVEPDRRALDYHAETRADAGRRLRAGFVYAADGDVDGGDVAIAALDPATEINATWTLDGVSHREMAAAMPWMEHYTGPYRARLEERAADVDAQTREELFARRQARLVDGCSTETYRRVTAQAALEALAPIDHAADAAARATDRRVL